MTFCIPEAMAFPALLAHREDCLRTRPSLFPVVTDCAPAGVYVVREHASHRGRTRVEGFELCRPQQLEHALRARVARVQAGLKSSLIMQEESTSARAGSIASDWYHLGRVRSFDEIQREIDALTPEKIVGHLRRQPPQNYTIVTLGPKALVSEFESRS